MTEKEWNELSEFDQFVTHLGLSIWAEIITLDKLARKKRSVLVKEDKEWLLSFCPRFFADAKLRRFKTRSINHAKILARIL